jgi:hypothetical protein
MGKKHINYISLHFIDRIGGEMARMSTSSGVDRGIEPRLDQTKDYKIAIFFSAKHAVLKGGIKDCLIGISILCPSGASQLPADCCFNEQELNEFN